MNKMVETILTWGDINVKKIDLSEAIHVLRKTSEITDPKDTLTQKTILRIKINPSLKRPGVCGGLILSE